MEDAGRRQLVGARQRVGSRPVARTESPRGAEGLEEHGLEQRGGAARIKAGWVTNRGSGEIRVTA